jgi:hypothetical protein
MLAELLLNLGSHVPGAGEPFLKFGRLLLTEVYNKTAYLQNETQPVNRLYITVCIR